ncbi:MAG: DUF1013 domain-containing protein [Holosporales bacterium]|jgi:hypothetical protein|nr:DUF1013 domain-containing protein [Holosporales bacterium]
MNLPLMPKATAIWLIENTSLTFKQISEFCGLHILEIESLANGDMDSKMLGFDPVISSQLTTNEIKRCEDDSTAKLTLNKIEIVSEGKNLNKKYTPRAKRHDKPDGIAWLIKYYPNLPEKDICDLLSTTKATIKAIKNKTHKNSSTIKPKSPVSLGLCTDAELEFVISKLTRE